MVVSGGLKRRLQAKLGDLASGGDHKLRLSFAEIDREKPIRSEQLE